MTDKDIWKKSERIVFEHFFCNVDDDNWPKNPWRFMDKLRNNQLDFSEEIDGEKMEIVEAFEDCSVGDIIRTIYELTDSINSFACQVKGV